VEHVVGNQSRPDQESLSRLWDVFDDPHLNKTLGLPQNSGITLRPYPGPSPAESHAPRSRAYALPSAV
jgi:hypothetical protein